MKSQNKIQNIAYFWYQLILYSKFYIYIYITVLNACSQVNRAV